jgi:hypothetical protein
MQRAAQPTQVALALGNNHAAMLADIGKKGVRIKSWTCFTS